MPTKTFDHLSDDKKQRINRSLLTEFSQHSLATAQVSRIVKNAGIARGAFYKYFADLSDAYRYLYHQVMAKLHQPIDLQVHQPADHYLQMLQTFLNDVDHYQYRNLVKLHLQTNADLLARQGSEKSTATHLTTSQWMVMTLVHETLIDCLDEPNREKQLLTRLKEALMVTLKEG